MGLLLSSSSCPRLLRFDGLDVTTEEALEEEAPNLEQIPLVVLDTRVDELDGLLVGLAVRVDRGFVLLLLRFHVIFPFFWGSALC